MYNLSGDDIVSLLSIKSEQLKDIIESDTITEEVHAQLTSLLSEMTELGAMLSEYIVRGEDEEEAEDAG